VKRCDRRQDPGLEIRYGPRRKNAPRARACQHNQFKVRDNRLKIRLRNGAVAPEHVQIVVKGRARQEGRERALRVGNGLGVEQRKPLRGAASARRCTQIKKNAAADGAPSGRVAQDESITHRGREPGLQNKLHPPLAPGRNRRILKQCYAGPDLGCRMVQANGCPVGERACLGGKDTNPGVNARARRVQFRRQHHIAAYDCGFADALAGEVERAAISRLSPLRGPVLGMNGAHAGGKA
jgi:hypothetical protein